MKNLLRLAVLLFTTATFSQAGHIMQGVGSVNMSMGGAATAQPIDIVSLGGSNQVSLTFRQYGARFNDLQEIQMSTDGTTWITIGDNDGPAHMHINSEMVDSAEFIQEQKPDKISFSVRFFDKSDDRVIAAFFTKMYDESKNLISSRKELYESLDQKYSSKIKF